jgi:hypothetical protein
MYRNKNPYLNIKDQFGKQENKELLFSVNMKFTLQLPA